MKTLDRVQFHPSLVSDRILLRSHSLHLLPLTLKLQARWIIWSIYFFFSSGLNIRNLEFIYTWQVVHCEYFILLIFSKITLPPPIKKAVTGRLRVPYCSACFRSLPKENGLWLIKGILRLFAPSFSTRHSHFMTNKLTCLSKCVPNSSEIKLIANLK